MTNDDYLLWADVETTGLDSAADQLLEVAFVVTHLDRELTQVGEPFSAVFQARDVDLLHLSPDVVEMHARSGLWRDVMKGGEPGPIWERFGFWRKRLQWHMGETFYLAGRSVHFDREWLYIWMPSGEYEALRLSHRHFDLSSIKMFAGLAAFEFGVQEEAHRALPDVLGDIELARKLIKMLALP